MSLKPPQEPWPQALTQTLAQLRAEAGREPRLALIGVGSDLYSDDAAGLLLIRALRAQTSRENVLLVEAGIAPENVTGAVRRFQPDLVLFVDAACMDEPPGAVRWLDPQDADGMCASTHTLPLSMVAGYLAAEVGCRTALIGIQPGSLNMRAVVTPDVMSAVRDITATLLNALLFVQE